MNRDRYNSTIPPSKLVSLFRGLYGRVARELGVDPSYVSRVARGERNSETVQAALEKEMRKILERANHEGREPFPAISKRMKKGFDGHADGHADEAHEEDGSAEAGGSDGVHLVMDGHGSARPYRKEPGEGKTKKR